jgi:hypothetical protein
VVAQDPQVAGLADRLLGRLSPAGMADDGAHRVVGVAADRDRNVSGSFTIDTSSPRPLDTRAPPSATRPRQQHSSHRSGLGCSRRAGELTTKSPPRSPGGLLLAWLCQIDRELHLVGHAVKTNQVMICNAPGIRARAVRFEIAVRPSALQPG